MSEKENDDIKYMIADFQTKYGVIIHGETEKKVSGSWAAKFQDRAGSITATGTGETKFEAAQNALKDFSLQLGDDVNENDEEG